MRRAAGLLALFVGLAVLHTWPLATNPAGLSRLDNDDTGLNVFVTSWVAHIVPRDPLALFHAPIFFPERHTLAYSEHMLVPSLIGAPLLWAGVDSVTVYNLLLIAGFALSGWTMALVVGRWADSTLAGVAAGMLYAFNAHLLTRLAHLQAIHIQFLPLALMGLDQLLRSAPRPSRVTQSAQSATAPPSAQSAFEFPPVPSAKSAQPAAALSSATSALEFPGVAPSAQSAQSAAAPPSAKSALEFPSELSAQSAKSAAAFPSAKSVLESSALLTTAFVLQSLCSNYTLVFLAVALLICAIVRANEWLTPGTKHRRLALLASAAIAVTVLAPFLWPYYVVSREQGLSRSIDEVALYSASWADYLATGGRLHYAWWSHTWFEGRTPLFPGVIGLMLAGSTLWSPELRRDPRVRMVVAVGVGGLALSFGTALPGYAWIHQHVPLFEGLRAAARWGLLFLTAVAVLAGFAVGRLERRWRGRTYWPAAATLLLALITLEALRAPLAFVGVPSVPAFYADLAKEPDAVVVELPLFFGPSVSENARYLLHGTRHFRPMVNGYSGFEPEAFRQRAARWRAFPEPAVLEEMAALGVTHVVVDTRELNPSQVDAAASTVSLSLTVEEDGRRLYRLRP